MKSTGIIRRVDDLGRINIPKEIRRQLKIEEGAPFEIYISQKGEIIIKPHRTNYICEKLMTGKS